MSSGGTYDPHAVEAEIYKQWEDAGHFHAESDATRKPFTIVIPPPNVTGALHLGHALNSTCQDILIRWRKMKGYNAEWMPGTDHAGIATQAVVEKRIRAEEGKTRREIGREGLVERIWKWKEQYNDHILTQLRKMGCACDWPRTRFTLDEFCGRAVDHAFFEFFKAGLIFRGLRLVNWDVALQTAVADDEIVYETVKGHLWHIRYPVDGAKGPRGQGAEGNASASALPEGAKEGVDYLVVVTTRPETMLGDTAVAVHPDDDRYKHLIGKHCILPLMNRRIPIIADGLLVKREFGTGCVKVTPGHDPNDHACWQRHQGEPDAFEIIDLLTVDGKINENGKGTGNRDQGTGPPSSRSPFPVPRSLPSFDYTGMKKEDARKKVVADVESIGLLEKVEPYQTEVGHSDRSKTPIEPLRSEQWFMKMGDLAEDAMEAVRDGRVRFFPERYAKTYLDWLGEKRDWCISRQLWWGHRIPVWRVTLQAGLHQDELKSIRRSLERVKVEFGQALDDFASACDVPGEFAASPSELSKSIVYVCARSSRAREQLTAFYSRHHPARSTEPFERDRPVEPYLQLNDPRQSADGRLWEMIASMEDQDPDVLDTWFSSGLWPMSTFGWPHEEKGSRDQGTKGPRDGVTTVPSQADFNYFFPTDVLTTGRGIITLWVARMVMMSLYFTKRVPFRHVYIHPILQDGQGRTMSKSLGNGVDPLDLIEQYGTDAMRFVLAQMATETQDIRVPVKPMQLPDGRTVNSSDRFELGRNFCNKLWQAATGFVLANLEGTGNGEQGTGWMRALSGGDLAVEDHWILSRLSACIAEVDRRLERYQFGDMANAIYSFFWNDFCGWYIELVKPRIQPADGSASVATDTANTARQVLIWVLDQTLRLLHPIMPFVSEAIWKRLNDTAPQRGISELIDGEPLLIAAAWPDAGAWQREADVEGRMSDLQGVITALRDIKARINTIRAASKQPAIKALPSASVRCNSEIAQGLNSQNAVVRRLAACESIEFGPLVDKPSHAFSGILTGIEIYVPVEGLADLEIEKQRLGKERDELMGYLNGLRRKLSNAGFVANAPAAVIEKERARMAQLTDKLETIEKNLEELA